MTLPGYGWLKRQLNSVEDVEVLNFADGHRGMPNGYNSSSSLVFLAIWLLALMPLCLFHFLRWLLRRVRAISGAS